MEPAPIANTQNIAGLREMFERQLSLGRSISPLAGLNPTAAINLKLIEIAETFPTMPTNPFDWRILDSERIKEILRSKACRMNAYEKISAKPPQKLNKNYSAEDYGKDDYKDAIASAKAALATIPPINIDDVSLPLDEISTTNDPEAQRDANINVRKMKMAYFDENGDWLKGCRKKIMAAADTGNEKFFLDLAALIVNRPRIRGQSVLGRSMMRPDDFLSTRLANFWRRIIAEYWVEWPLWLMSDAVGCDYVNKFCSVLKPERKNKEERQGDGETADQILHYIFQKEKMTESQYKKMRQTLVLHQHHKHPLRSFNSEGELQLCKGWKFPKS